MKKTTAILAAAVAGASIAGAEELSISSTFGWESDYVFRGVQLAEEFFAPSVDLSYGGYYAGIWAALPVDTVYGNEVDLYGGYGFGISETVSGDVGFTYYTYPDAQDDFFDSDVNTFEIYGGLSFEAPFSPAVYAFYDFDAGDGTFTIEASGGHSIEVSEDASVDFGLYLGYADPSQGDEWMYYGASAAYSYAFTDSAAFSVGLNFYGADEDLMGENFKNDTDNKITLSMSFTAGF
jgi:uncharacterized protein (TIGR02001 family)